MPTTIDTNNPELVADFVRERFEIIFPDRQPELLDRLFTDTTALFTGKHPDYQANDLKYHDHQHTLQATVCLTYLLEGRHTAEVSPRLTSRQFELAIAAVLLHDSGYQRTNSDTEGTGAKYTFIHVLRSCAYAASYLPQLGVTEYEIDGLLGAIRSTGPTSQIALLHFHDSIERTIGCSLATADYLAQMSAPDYPDELGFLYAEFKESYDFFNTPDDKRYFKSAADLESRTPDFWERVVRPKLENDYQAVYRFLTSPLPDGANSYIKGVEENIAKIKHRLARREAKTK